MTRNEAIFYIKELQKNYASMDKKVAEAVDMAIKALQNETRIEITDDGEIRYTGENYKL